jgi:hypothetical protein
MLLSLFLTKKLNYIISYSISIYYKTTLYNSWASKFEKV